MAYQVDVKKLRDRGRYVGVAVSGDQDLGPLSLLPGTWRNVPTLPGRGWNMIALPFATPPGQGSNYRLLLNQYNEELKFTLVDKGIPNRGILRTPPPPTNADQTLVGLDYQQSIQQIAADDSPQSGLAGPSGLAIHHEPGLWLHMIDRQTDGLDIARLATIPHGDSVLALGRSESLQGAPTIPNINGLPIGVPQDLDLGYLAPYKHFHDNPFQGLFDPVEPNALLATAINGVEIVRTTKLEVDTTIEHGGVVNIPFIVKQANAAAMKSTFWIEELKEKDDQGNPRLWLQYSQVVILDFFARFDGAPGLIRWPHVSINTLEKVTSPS